MNSPSPTPEAPPLTWWQSFVKLCVDLQAVIAIIGVLIVVLPIAFHYLGKTLRPDIHFGAREVVALDHAHFAETDGFVTAVAEATQNGYEMRCKVGTNENVNIMEQVAGAAGDKGTGIDNPGSVSFPVRQGEWWIVSVTGKGPAPAFAGTVYWIPLVKK
jgi:hypothetical protein